MKAYRIKTERFVDAIACGESASKVRSFAIRTLRQVYPLFPINNLKNLSNDWLCTRLVWGKRQGHANSMVEQRVQLSEQLLYECDYVSKSN